MSHVHSAVLAFFKQFSFLRVFIYSEMLPEAGDFGVGSHV